MSRRSDRIGVLLLNVGTPDAPHPREVRRYLREFLGDPRILDMNPIGRRLLLELVILPFRPRRSAEAYEKVWLPEGSPLLVHGRAHASGLGRALGAAYEVALGMRYGSASIAEALDGFRSRGIDRIVLFPLFPQYASATSGTSLEAAYRLAAGRWNVPSLSVVPAFYDDPGFIAAFAEVGRPVLRDLRPDHVLFSFHGLPERQVRKSDESGVHCLATASCCNAIGEANRNCYRAQCFATARALAGAASLAADGSTVAFQSRLGRIPWIRPYTDETVVDLARRGVKRLAVFCPAFVADCLETIEEIGLRAREDFLANGGEAFALVPSLNGNEAWIEASARLVRAAVWSGGGAITSP